MDIIIFFVYVYINKLWLIESLGGYNIYSKSYNIFIQKRYCSAIFTIQIRRSMNQWLSWVYKTVKTNQKILFRIDI